MMAHELCYTSAPRGLYGAGGFCTVAATVGLPRTAREKLESLSVDPLGRVVWSHLRLLIPGVGVRSVLSRVGPVERDYTGRTNYIAHHVLLDPGEQSEAGPAWLLRQASLGMRVEWIGEPAELPPRPVPRGTSPAGPCRVWADAGDAGWAGVMVEAFLSDPKRKTHVIHDPARHDPLALTVEALGLIPAAQRWEATFTTCWVQGGPGDGCVWRFLPAGSKEARLAERAPGTINLCHLPALAGGGPLVELARTGREATARGREPQVAGIAGEAAVASPTAIEPTRKENGASRPRPRRGEIVLEHAEDSGGGAGAFFAGLAAGLVVAGGLAASGWGFLSAQLRTERDREIAQAEASQTAEVDKQTVELRKAREGASGREARAKELRDQLDEQERERKKLTSTGDDKEDVRRKLEIERAATEQRAAHAREAVESARRDLARIGKVPEALRDTLLHDLAAAVDDFLAEKIDEAGLRRRLEAFYVTRLEQERSAEVGLKHLDADLQRPPDRDKEPPQHYRWALKAVEDAHALLVGSATLGRVTEWQEKHRAEADPARRRLADAVRLVGTDDNWSATALARIKWAADEAAAQAERQKLKERRELLVGKLVGLRKALNLKPNG